MEISLQFAAVTEIGRKNRNEDAFLAEKIGDFHIFAIADGLGGHAAGDVASTVAVTTVREYIGNHRPGKSCEFLRSMYREVNRRIFEYNSQQGSNAGTTLVTAIIDSHGHCCIGNIGDSRAYIFDNSVIWHTRDHSYVQNLIDRGILSSDEAFRHPMQHILNRALGLNETAEMDIYEISISESILMLSSDGLHDTVPETRLQELSTGLSPDMATRALVQEALNEQSMDNITVIVVKIGNEK